MTSSQTDRTAGLVAGASIKGPCRVAATSNVTASAEQTIDGVACVTGDRVLLTAQTSGVDNGIYVVDTGTWERALDCDGAYDLVTGSLVRVNAGTANSGFWYLSTTGTITIGTTSQTWAMASSTLAVISAFAQTLLDDTTAAQARTTLGAQADLSTLTEDTNPDESADFLVTYDTSGAAFKKAKPYLVRTRSAPGGRLTLTTAVPVTTSDVTGATTVYYTPYKGDEIALYDGTAWVPFQFTELSQATTDSTKSPAAVANNSNYDVFVWTDSGTLRATRGPAWSSDTVRGTGAGTTELEMYEGRLVNKVDITNGPAARRGLYVGSIRSNGSAQIEDSKTKRFVWNNSNRVARQLLRQEDEDTWTYSTNTYRYAFNDSANRVDVLLGLVEEPVDLTLVTFWSDSGAAGSAAAVSGIGLDSSTLSALDQIAGFGHNTLANSASANVVRYCSNPGLGFHFLAWLERSSTGATTTWRGDAGSAGTGDYRTGLTGSVFA